MAVNILGLMQLLYDVKEMNALSQSVTSIPWQRLTTAYGRGTEIPRLMETGQYEELANLIEHQGTIWCEKPESVHFLVAETTQPH
ncbi:hypothetical protein [Paenibacillus sp. MDMC362]|uniref:hypothetical protein n=1 Tax=Paenibacillus sp. MDMC362 TaxID=2977365 RepID=UPI000DC3E6E1|nr:hypothetical protein [Paenibacillus sp. MDMC362]RAR44458.1 hypothetical protein DP091_08685 [Paenibacillus sp. MDMC362]